MTQHTADQQQQAAPAPQVESSPIEIYRERVGKVAGSTRDLAEVRRRTAFASQHAHMVTPAMVAKVPEGFSIAFTVVYVDVETETYPVKGSSKRGLAKVALDRLCHAAGVTWDPFLSGRQDDGSDPRYCHFKAVGYVKKLDGTPRTLCDNKQMDLRDGSDQIAGMSEKQVQGQRAFILEHAESKARNRAIRDLGIRTAYEPEELQKPFVVASLMFTGETDDPELRRIFAEKMADAALNGSRALYGAQTSQAPAMAPHLPPVYVPCFAPPPVGQVLDDERIYDATPKQTPPAPPSEPKAQAAQAPKAASSEPKAAAETSPTSPLPIEGTVLIGDLKGTKLSALTDEQLSDYLGLVTRSAKELADTGAHKRAVLAELERREGSPPPADAAGKY